MCTSRYTAIYKLVEPPESLVERHRPADAREFQFSKKKKNIYTYDTDEMKFAAAREILRSMGGDVMGFRSKHKLGIFEF